MSRGECFGRAVYWVLLTAIGASAWGCTTPKMAVPPDLGPATEEVPIMGRSQTSGVFVNDDFKIGFFDVANVSRGAKHSSRFGGLGGFKSSEDSGYSFDLTTGDRHLHGECVVEANEGGAIFDGLTISNEHKKVACACGNEAEPVASVVLQASTTSPYGGTLKAQGASYEVKAVYDREGAISDGNPSGYRVDGDGVQGAVDVLGPGRVWLAKSLDGEKRTDVTCMFAGLLLFKPATKQ